MRARFSRTLAVATLAVGLFATSVPGADGLVSRANLRRVPGSLEPDAKGGVETWLLVRGDGSVQQRFQVWVQGLFDAEGSTLWMAKPGDIELEQVGEFAFSGGSGRFQVGIDTARDGEDLAELPMGVEKVLELLRAPVEVRVPGDEFDDEPVLEGEVGVFRLRSVHAGSQRKGVSSRRSKLRRPRDPLPVLEPTARGYVRLWKRTENLGFGPELVQGITVYAQGLTEDADYEIWMEDPAGDLQYVGDAISTAEGQALYALSTADGDTLPSELDVEDVSDLVGARVEFRRSGDATYALAGLCPRVK
jgi:hypothetical protein